MLCENFKDIFIIIFDFMIVCNRFYDRKYFVDIIKFMNNKIRRLLRIIWVDLM